MKAVGCYVAFNRSFGGVGNLIAAMSTPLGYLLNPKGWKHLKSIPSHARIGFILEDGSHVYYEAREFTDKGFTGPIPEMKIALWKQKNQGAWTRKYFLDWAISPEAAERIHQRSIEMTGVWTYSMRQNILVGVHRFTGIPIPETLNAVNCSESVTRLLDLELHLGWRKKRPDSMTPSDLEDAIRGVV